MRNTRTLRLTASIIGGSALLGLAACGQGDAEDTRVGAPPGAAPPEPVQQAPLAPESTPAPPTSVGDPTAPQVNPGPGNPPPTLPGDGVSPSDPIPPA